MLVDESFADRKGSVVRKIREELHVNLTIFEKKREADEGEGFGEGVFEWRHQCVSGWAALAALSVTGIIYSSSDTGTAFCMCRLPVPANNEESVREMTVSDGAREEAG